VISGPGRSTGLDDSSTEDRGWCETCGVRATGHGRRPVVVRDLPMAERPVVLVWAKRLWRCDEPTCAAHTWPEPRQQSNTDQQMSFRNR
jgi:transposase